MAGTALGGENAEDVQMWADTESWSRCVWGCGVVEVRCRDSSTEDEQWEGTKRVQCDVRADCSQL